MTPTRPTRAIHELMITNVPPFLRGHGERETSAATERSLKAVKTSLAEIYTAELFAKIGTKVPMAVQFATDPATGREWDWAVAQRLAIAVNAQTGADAGAAEVREVVVAATSKGPERSISYLAVGESADAIAKLKPFASPDDLKGIMLLTEHSSR
jgi:hypothetical protein